jgi:hypothetical protein
MIQVSNLEALVDNWLRDVQRRGMKLYALNRGNNVLYVSFERKDRLRFSLEVGFTVESEPITQCSEKGIKPFAEAP